MKKEFDFNLEVKSFFPLYIAFFIPWLILEVLILVQSSRLENMGSRAPMAALTTLMLVAALFFLTVLLYIPILRKIIPAVSYDNKAYHFRGSIGKFLGLNLLGGFLTVITAGIYGPWYITRVCRYLAGETSYMDEPLTFVGKGGRLLGIILLTIVVPVIPLALVQAGLGQSPFGSGADLNPFQSFMLLALVQLIFWSFFCAYLYLIYRWFFTQIRYGNRLLSWNTSFWSSVAMIWVQFLLSALTLGIYLPAAYIRLYRYFVERTEIQEEQKPAGRLQFQGQAGRGFALLWAQILLTLVTLGIYAPWALAKIGKWMLSNTYFEPS